MLLSNVLSQVFIVKCYTKINNPNNNCNNNNNNNNNNNSDNRDLLRIIATAIFISAIAKLIPMQFLRRSRDKNLANEKKIENTKTKNDTLMPKKRLAQYHSDQW